jgi:hypothetical protein
MRFHVILEYPSESRENLLKLVETGALHAEETIKVIGAWIAAETGSAFAVMETNDARALYGLCSNWSEYGTVHVTPVISIKEL